MKLSLVFVLLSFFSIFSMAQVHLPAPPVNNKTVIMQPCTMDNSCGAESSKSTSRKENANGNSNDRKKSTSRKVNANGNAKDQQKSTSRKVNANTQ